MLLRRARPLLGAISAVAVQQRCAARAHESENASVVERTTRAAPGANPVTQNEQYIKGIKLYDIGILEDPIPGEKRGKGLQHLTSSYFTYDLAVFINREFRAMQAMARYAHARSATNPGYDFRYFTNCSNALFLKAEAEGLATRDGRDFFLMAAWLAMAAAEVDGFEYSKYTPAQRRAHREGFYRKYLTPSVIWIPDEADDPQVLADLGKYAIESSRIDLLPTVALERLGIHNELCALKWSDPTVWMREGFDVASRLASMKRHFESVHASDSSEDHLAHLIWGFMALTHVIAVFPQLNNLTNYEAIRRRNVSAADQHVMALVGDGGFRAGVARQSARAVRTLVDPVHATIEDLHRGDGFLPSPARAATTTAAAASKGGSATGQERDAATPAKSGTE